MDDSKVKELSVQKLKLQDSTIKEMVERYLSQKYFPDSRRQIDQAESLFALGILDSLALVQLISFIESEFRIAVDDAEVVAENFQSLNAIAGLVSRIREKG